MSPLNQTQPARGHRLAGLDGLRAISIALVIIWHAQDFEVAGRLIPVLGRVNLGALGVSLFFTISGFLITWLLLREEVSRKSISLTHFYQRRAVRILPPALAYLLVLLVASEVRGVIDWKRLIASMFFFRNLIIGNATASVIVDTSHYWSLAVEEQFYLIWPLILVLLRPRFRVPFLFAVLAALPLWRNFNYHWLGAANVNVGRGDLQADCIVAGCLLACLLEIERWKKFLAKPIFCSLFTIILCVLAATLTESLGAMRLPSKITFFYPTICAICTSVLLHRVLQGSAGEKRLLDRVLRISVLVVIGQLSYSLYLWQQPFCMPHGIFHTPFIPLNIFCTVVCALLSYFLIELPMQAVRRRLGSRTLPSEISGEIRPSVPSDFRSGEECEATA